MQGQEHLEEDAPIPSLEGLIRAAMDAPGGAEELGGVHPDVDQIGEEAQFEARADVIGEPTTTISSLPEQGRDPVHLNLVDTYMSTEFEQQAQDPNVQALSEEQLVHPDPGTLQTDDDLGMQIGDDLHNQAEDQTHVQGDGMLIPEDMSSMDVHAVGAAYNDPSETAAEQDQTSGHPQPVDDQAMQEVEEAGMEQDLPDQVMQGQEGQLAPDDSGLVQQEEQVVEHDQEQVDGQQELVNLEMHIDGDGTGVSEQQQHVPAAPEQYQEVHVEQEQLPVDEHGQTTGADQIMTEGEPPYLGTEESAIPEAGVENTLQSTAIEAIAPDQSQGEVGLPAAGSATVDQTTAIHEVPPTLAAEPAPPSSGPATTGRRKISASASGSGLKVPSHQTQNQGQGQTQNQGQGEELAEALIGKTREEIDDIKRRIVDRLESLLSATALPHDKLLFSLSLRNTAGWIPLSTVAKYPKIRSYADTYGLAFMAESVREANDSRADGQEDVTPTVNPDGTAIAGSSTNGMPGEEPAKRGKKVGPAFLGRGKDAELVVDGKGERVRRKDVISKADTAWDRTVYAEGFGILDPSTTTTQDAIEEWFEQFAPITVVRFRRGRDPFGGKGRGDFRGSVFCEFRTVEGADLFLRTNPKPLFNGTEIVAMFKETYLESRIQLKALRHSNVIPIEQIEPESLQAIDKSLLKIGNKKRKREEEEESAVQKRNTVLYILFNKHRVGVSRKTGSVMNKNELVFPDRALLKFTGAGETGDWKILKEDLVNAEIEHSFLYLPRRSTYGYFAAPEAIGDEVVERLRNLHLIVGDSEIEWERVEGQEERDFYAKRASFQGKLAVKMADEKECLELDAVKETTKELRNAGKERARGKSVTSGSGKKKASGSAGNSVKKGKSEDDSGAMLTEGMQLDE